MTLERHFIKNWQNIMSKKIQLFCIPFAGGSSTAFNELCQNLDEFVVPYVIEYPGRGSRMKEPFAENLEMLMKDVKEQIVNSRIPGIPFALFGYSMGTAIAYDMAQFELEESPVHLFASAREALFHYIKSQEYALMERDEFKQKIIDFGGINEQILKNERFLDIYMKPIYADYKLWNQYVYKEKGKLNCKITVFYSEKDTPYEKVIGWREMTKKRVDFYEYGRNHFFIQHHAKEMAEIINKNLFEYLN